MHYCSIISVFTLSASPASCLGRHLWEERAVCPVPAVPHPAPAQEHGTWHSSFLHSEYHRGNSAFSLRGNSINPAEPQLCSTTSQNRAAVGRGLYPAHLGVWKQLPQNRHSTATRASLGFGNGKNKHKGSAHSRNGKETGKHG